MDVTARFPVMAGVVAALAGYVLVEIVPPLLQALGIFGLVVLGYYLGYNWPRHWWLLSLSAISLNLTVAIYIILTEGSNIWPIAMALHVLLAGPVLLGAWFGKDKAAKILKSTSKEQP
jgi:hypothetical protein